MILEDESGKEDPQAVLVRRASFEESQGTLEAMVEDLPGSYPRVQGSRGIRILAEEMPVASGPLVFGNLESSRDVPLPSGPDEAQAKPDLPEQDDFTVHREVAVLKAVVRDLQVTLRQTELEEQDHSRQLIESFAFFHMLFVASRRGDPGAAPTHLVARAIWLTSATSLAVRSDQVDPVAPFMPTGAAQTAGEGAFSGGEESQNSRLSPRKSGRREIANMRGEGIV